MSIHNTYDISNESKRWAKHSNELEQRIKQLEQELSDSQIEIESLKLQTDDNLKVALQQAMEKIQQLEQELAEYKNWKEENATSINREHIPIGPGSGYDSDG